MNIWQALKISREDWNARTTELGHTISWSFDRACKTYTGECSDCGARILVRSCSTSCDGVRDARSTECSGPGTKILTEIEQARCSELIGAALADFRRAIRAGTN